MVKNNKPGTVRIIAGEWRGRRLLVPDLPGLRPSGDRSRETLFNWLQGELRGARCVDLFAGTGVLGLEALSRGAASVVLVEKDPKAAAQLRANVSLLKADNAKVLQEDALAWLKSQSAATAADTPATTPAATPVDIPADDPAGNLARRFDLAFVDPPFNLGLATTTLQLLQQLPLLQPGGLVYLETARSETVPTQGWETLRDKTLGEVRMQLLRRLSVAQQAPAKPPAGC